MREVKKYIIYKLQYILIPIIILLIWQVGSFLGIIKEYTISSPIKVLITTYQMIKSTVLLENILWSVFRVIIGFLLAAILGISFGILTARSKTFAKYTDCILQIIKPIPPIAWIPIAILWFGIGEFTKIFIIFLGAFFPIFSNVVDGIKQIDSKYIEVAEVLEIPKRKMILKVILLGALPSIMTGLRVGLGSAWMCVVAAEMIAATRGVGYMLMDGRSLSRPDIVILGMFVIGIIGKVMNDFLLKLEKRKIYWNRKK